MAAQQQPNQSDNSMAIVWIVGAILIFGAIIWMAFKKSIIAFYFKIKLYEINLLSHFTNRFDDVRAALLTTDPSKFTFQDVLNVGAAVGNYIRFPMIIVILILAAIVFFTNSTRVFKRIYTMRDLAKLEQPNWPQITPVVNLDLIKTDIDKGPWAMALTPMQFCKRHNLLQEFKRPPQEGMTHKEWNRIDVSLKRGDTNKIFVLQLGPLWPGINRVPPHIRALFAAFAARINGDAKATSEFFTSINRSAAGKLDFSGVDALLKKYADSKIVQGVVQSHAYLLTVMAEMLAAARSDGVQASSDFLWLKPVDRRLWYMLNTVGRQTPFVEVAGPFAHWIAERALGKRLLVPMVEEATNALELALKEIVYRPDEKE